MDLFVVYENQNGAVPKVHNAGCRHYRHYMEAQSTRTTAWHGPFDTLKEALEKCREIAKKRDIYPRLAQCCDEHPEEIKEILAT